MRPFAHGADIVVHSLTKSITRRRPRHRRRAHQPQAHHDQGQNDQPLFKDSFAEYVKFLPYRDNGPSASPVNAIFALNDLRTLRSQDGRRQRQLPEGRRVPQKHPKVYQVDYLGLPSYHLHEVAKKYMKLVDSERRRGP